MIQEGATNKGNYAIGRFMEWISSKGRYMTAGTLLTYHKSWEELMPVVEKIEELGFYTDSEDWKNCHFFKISEAPDYDVVAEGKGKERLEAVWLAVIEFIKWYNNQPKFKQ